jgi:hypothetical protein
MDLLTLGFIYVDLGIISVDWNRGVAASHGSFFGADTGGQSGVASSGAHFC